MLRSARLRAPLLRTPAAFERLSSSAAAAPPAKIALIGVRLWRALHVACGAGLPASLHARLATPVNAATRERPDSLPQAGWWAQGWHLPHLHRHPGAEIAGG